MSRHRVHRPLMIAALIAWTTMIGGCGGAKQGRTATPAPAPAPSPTPAPASTALSIVNGYGPASATAGTTVELWSRVVPATDIVTSWTGAPFASDEEEWHVSLTVPASPATLTASIQSFSLSFDTRSYAAPTTVAKTARFYLPPAPRGLVLILHGTGGASSFIERNEARYVALKAISKGYAVLAPEAEESQAGDLDGDGKQRWDVRLSPSNIDLAALDQLIGSFYSSGQLPSGTPLYVLGMSNGGAMAVTLGAVGSSGVASTFPRLRFRAAISYCAQARPDAVAVTTTPTAWYLCGNDDNAEVSNANALANSATLSSRGIATVAALHPATPLFDERFARVSGVSVAQSRAIAQEMRTAGFLDSNGFFTTPGSGISAAVSANPTRFPTLVALTLAQQSGILSQISVMRAEHEFYSDWAARSLRWFATYP